MDNLGVIGRLAEGTGHGHSVAVADVVLVVDPVEKGVHHESVRAQELDEPGDPSVVPDAGRAGEQQPRRLGGPVTLSARMSP